jgi:hypothetical protein
VPDRADHLILDRHRCLRDPLHQTAHHASLPYRMGR